METNYLSVCSTCWDWTHQPRRESGRTRSKSEFCFVAGFGHMVGDEIELHHEQCGHLPGNMGILRVVNARRLNEAVGSHGAEVLRRWKEQVGLGQYRVIVARKE